MTPDEIIALVLRITDTLADREPLVNVLNLTDDEIECLPPNLARAMADAVKAELALDLEALRTVKAIHEMQVRKNAQNN